jgi:hypothetical protein
MGRVRLFFQSGAILLMLLTLALNLTLREAVARNNALIDGAIPAQAAPAAAPPVSPPILQAELPEARDAQVLAYLSALDGPRARLRDAVEAYKAATNQPGGSSVGHAAAARTLREQIDAANEAIVELKPPPTLAQAHAEYLAGLELERAALGDMLEFYNSFSISIANRATLRLEDADKHLQRARTQLDSYPTRMAHAVARQTAR